MCSLRFQASNNTTEEFAHGSNTAMGVMKCLCLLLETDFFSRGVFRILYCVIYTFFQSILHTGDGDEAKLVCIVHGHPTPEVSWKRGGHLVASDKHLMTHDGEHRHSLIIRHVQEDDFGVYTCFASNKHGVTNSTLSITGQFIFFSFINYTCVYLKTNVLTGSLLVFPFLKNLVCIIC